MSLDAPSKSGCMNLAKTELGMMGPEKTAVEIRRITRYEEWCNLVEDPDMDNDDADSPGGTNEAGGIRIARTPPTRSLRHASRLENPTIEIWDRPNQQANDQNQCVS
jgi:hypothetical protein